MATHRNDECLRLRYYSNILVQQGPSNCVTEYEGYAFRRSEFPTQFRGHRLTLLKNTGYFTVDERLSFHIIIYCSACDSEESIRGRLPPDQSSPEKMAYIKLAVLGAFKDRCSKNNRKVYYGSSHTP